MLDRFLTWLVYLAMSAAWPELMTLAASVKYV
jgi:hypothetical protein